MKKEKEAVRKKTMRIVIAFAVLFALVIITNLIVCKTICNKRNNINTEIEKNQTGLNDEVKEGNKNKYYNGTKAIGNIELSNLYVYKENDSKSYLNADIKNTSTEFHEAELIKINIIDENGEISGTFSAVLNELAGLETGKFKTQAWTDLTKATDFRIEVIEE